MNLCKLSSLTVIAAAISLALISYGSEAATKTDKRECAKLAKGCPKAKPKAKSSKSVLKFKSCKAAKAAGYSNMKRGQAGYSTNLDRDNDGIACDK